MILKKITKLIIAILLAAAFVGCPTEQSGSETTTNNKITKLQTVIDKAKDGDTINLSKYSDIKDYSATINKAVTINGSQTNLKNATLTVEKDATINGITNASVTASSSLGNGSLQIASSSLSNLTINGGGINSIIIIDVTIDDVSIDKQETNNTNDQYVRFCIDANVHIGSLNIACSTLIDVTGDASADADKLNIRFAAGKDVCVAFNNKINITTPENKAKASFGLDNSDDSGFFIIVGMNKPIEQKFFNQVSTKIFGKQFTAYEEGSQDQFDFTKPIERDTQFFGKPQDQQQPPPPPLPQIWTVTFDANGGAWTSHDTSMDVTVDDGKPVSKPADPSKTDYDFVYWYLATATNDESYDFTKPLSGNITLKAKWAEKPITAGGNIVIKDYAFIIDTTHDMTCDLSGDTLIFTAKLNGEDITSSCVWNYELSYGNIDLTSDYWQKSSNVWRIGNDMVFTDSPAAPPTLPKVGVYQLFVKAEKADFAASAVYSLNIKRKQGD